MYVRFSHPKRSRTTYTWPIEVKCYSHFRPCKVIRKEAREGGYQNQHVQQPSKLKHIYKVKKKIISIHSYISPHFICSFLYSHLCPIPSFLFHYITHFFFFNVLLTLLQYHHGVYFISFSYKMKHAFHPSPPFISAMLCLLPFLHHLFLLSFCLLAILHSVS